MRLCNGRSARGLVVDETPHQRRFSRSVGTGDADDDGPARSVHAGLVNEDTRGRMAVRQLIPKPLETGCDRDRQKPAASATQTAGASSGSSPPSLCLTPRAQLPLDFAAGAGRGGRVLGVEAVAAVCVRGGCRRLARHCGRA